MCWHSGYIKYFIHNIYYFGHSVSSDYHCIARRGNISDIGGYTTEVDSRSNNTSDHK